MLIIGLTGGIASGKSFVEKQLQLLEIPVFDADYEVHNLFSTDKKLFSKIKKEFPNSIVSDQIDRKILGSEVFEDKKKLEKLEKIIYPALHEKEDKFIKENRRKKQKLVVLNIPLLFEKGGYKRCDKTIVVVASKKVRFERFCKRFKNVDKKKLLKKFNQINSNQMTDLEKRKKADFVIYNSLSKAFCVKQIKSILKTICNLQNPAL